MLMLFAKQSDSTFDHRPTSRGRTTHAVFCALLIASGAYGPLAAQSSLNRPQFMERGLLRRDAQSTTILAKHPRPLLQAVLAASEEYGWVVDYEDPPYSGYDLADDTDPRWRAAHPGMRGFTRPAGGYFESTYTEGSNPFAATEPDKRRILGKIISDYNASSNPGRFILRENGDGTYAIVGSGVRTGPTTVAPTAIILDTPISIPTGTRDALSTVQLILKALATRTDIMIIQGTMARNGLRQTTVTVGGDNIPARTLLLQTLAPTKRRLVWQLLYDADPRMYALNLLSPQRIQFDTFGNTIRVPIDRYDLR